MFYYADRLRTHGITGIKEAFCTLRLEHILPQNHRISKAIHGISNSNQHSVNTDILKKAGGLWYTYTCNRDARNCQTKEIKER